MRGVKVPFSFTPSLYENGDFQAKGGLLTFRLLHRTSVLWLPAKTSVFQSLVHVGMKAGSHCSSHLSHLS